LFLLLPSCSAQEQKPREQSPLRTSAEAKGETAGVMFGVPVPAENYYFAMRVALMFGTPWGNIPNNVDELEKRTWDDLLLSYEAFRRDIQVERTEIEDEIAKTLKGRDVEFDWKQDKEAYEKWVKDTLNESVGLFENQMQHLVQLKKLRNQFLSEVEPTVEVTEGEALQEFRNEYNTLDLELFKFDDLEKAEEFYRKILKDPELWISEKEIEEKKERKDSYFRKTGFVALEFLMHMWKFPKKHLYNMIGMEVGSFYQPIPIYEGYGVFKIIKVRQADEADFPERKKGYIDQLSERKKHQQFYRWRNKTLRKEADIEIYIKPPDDLFRSPTPKSD